MKTRVHKHFYCPKDPAFGDRGTTLYLESTQILNVTVKTKMEGMVEAKNRQMEAKLRTGQEESESRLEDQLARMQGRLDDMEDRFAISDATLRRTEEKLREIHGEVRSVF